MEGPWTRDEASAAGQVFEDRIWALLMEQSRGHLHVFRPHMSSFRPAPTTYFTVIAWMPAERRFHYECLVIPSELLQFARPTGSHYKFEFQPGSKNQPRLDKYRRALLDLSAEVETLLVPPTAMI